MIASATASTLVLTVATIGGFVFSHPADAATPTTPPDTCFAFNAATGTITDYYDNEGNNSTNSECTRDVAIPSAIGGTPVTGIGNYAFRDNRLTSVTIPNSVTSLGFWAFAGNQLTSVTIPDSLTSLTGAVFAENSLTSVTIPDSVTNIGVAAFFSNQLADISIPSSVTSIDDYAFSNNHFTTFEIPMTVTSVGDGILVGNEIASITYNNISYTASTPNDDECFEFNPTTGMILGFKYMNLMGMMEGSSPCLALAITIPSTIDGVNVTAIGEKAFYISRGLFGVGSTGVSFGTTHRITSITIPSSVTTIGSRAFQDNNLTSVAIPESVTSIGDSAFSSNRLTTATIPDSVKTIGASAFYNNQLASVTIGSAITSIGDSAFSNNKLTTVTIPDSVTNIGKDILVANPLTSLTVNGNTRTSTDPNDEACYIFDAGTGAITGFSYANVNSVRAGGSGCLNLAIEIPATIDGVAVTAIGNSAFSRKGLTSVTIGNSVTTIGAQAFYSNNLNSITIPDSVTAIGAYAFYSNQLTSVTIGNSVTSVDNSAFLGNPLASATVSDPTLASLFVSDPETDFDSAFIMCIISIVPTPTDPSEFVPCYNDTLASISGTFFRIYMPGNSTSADSITSAQETVYSGVLGLPAPSLTSGMLTNPASVTLRYIDQDGHQIKDPEQRTGIRNSDGLPLTNYSIADSEMSAPVDPNNPTTAETAAMNAGFAQYFRIGQTETFTPPAITGYLTGSPQTVTLDSAQNTVTFVYQIADTPGTPSGDTHGAPNTGINPDGILADTGANTWLIGSAAALLVLLSLARLTSLRR